MTQIVQGKNREIQPLVDRRRLVQPASFGALYPAQQFAAQSYNQAPIEPFYETPKKEAQYAFGDDALMNTQESTPFIKHPVDGAPAPFNTYEDVQMRFASPVRGSSLHPFGQTMSPVKVGVRMQQIEKNDFQPHTPQFQRPSMKMNLNLNHCQSAAAARQSFNEPLVGGAPENPFNVKVSSFDPEAELKPKLAPQEATTVFARKTRKYSMNENEFSNDILTKVNKNEAINQRDISPER